MSTQYNVGFVHTNHRYLQRAVNLLYSTGNEGVLSIFKEVNKRWKVCHINFVPNMWADGSINTGPCLIEVNDKFKDREKVHKVAMIIFYELVNAINDFHKTVYDAVREDRDKYVFLREISEWRYTLLPYRKITEQLFFNCAWPKDAISVVPTNPDLYFIQQQLTFHSTDEAHRWDDAHHVSRRPAAMTLPRPVTSEKHKEELIRLITVRIQKESEFDSVDTEKWQHFIDGWASYLQSASYGDGSGLELPSEEDFDNFLINAKLVLTGSKEELREIHAELWETYDRHQQAWNEHLARIRALNSYKHATAY